MSISSRYPHYAPIAHHIEAAQLGRVVAVAEYLADLVVALVDEFKAPPRPAWIIVQDQESRRGGERFMRVAPR